MTALAHPVTTARRDLLRGAVLAKKYTLLRPIGAGGMGEVWLACNEATGAEVALKILLPQAASAAELSVRFRREAYTTARLSHPNIVRIFDLVEIERNDESSLALVMEVLHGQTLTRRLCGRAMGLGETLAILLPLLSALSYAHDEGIVHRDFKPDNIFLAIDSEGVLMPKLLDFGISKMNLPEAPSLTGRGEIVGTPSYMSPEQVRGMPSVDARSDIFNAGILLYEMLSGRNPYAGSERPQFVAILEHKPTPIAGLDPEVWSVIERALEKSPSARFASIADLSRALRRAAGLPEMATSPARVEAPSAPAVSRLSSRRVRAVVLGVAAVGLTMGFTLSQPVATAWGARERLQTIALPAAASPTPTLDVAEAAPVPVRTEPTPLTAPPRLPTAVMSAASSAPKTHTRSAIDRRRGILREPGF